MVSVDLKMRRATVTLQESRFQRKQQCYFVGPVLLQALSDFEWSGFLRGSDFCQGGPVWILIVNDQFDVAVSKTM